MRLAGVLFLFVLLSACASHKTKVPDMPASETMTPPPAPEAQDQPQEMTEIDFNKGKTDLTPESKKKIQRLVDTAQRQGSIANVKAITWGDLEYPSVHNSNDLDKDVTLVVKRNDVLGKYLKKLLEDKDVEMFNMAEREVSINQIATDEKIRTSLEIAGIPNTDTSVKVPGKASKSIVIFIMEEE